MAALMPDGWWVLRLNTFPDHPLWTLFVEGARRFDIDDVPAAWGRPASQDHPALDPAELDRVIGQLDAVAVYGSEVGAACDNFCCG